MTSLRSAGRRKFRRASFFASVGMEIPHLGRMAKCHIDSILATCTSNGHTDPRLRDPQYGNKLRTLRQRLRRERGRPLIVALGSSRVNMGFRPDVIASHAPASGDSPLLFNFGLNAAGPIMELLCLRRLLDEG